MSFYQHTFFKALHSELSSASNSMTSHLLTTAKIHSPTDAIDIFKQIKLSLMHTLECSRPRPESILLENLEMVCTRLSSYRELKQGTNDDTQSDPATSQTSLAAFFTPSSAASLFVHNQEIDSIKASLATLDMSSLCSTPYDEVMLNYVTEYLGSILEKSSTRTTVLAIRPTELIPEPSAISVSHHIALPTSSFSTAPFGSEQLHTNALRQTMAAFQPLPAD